MVNVIKGVDIDTPDAKLQELNANDFVELRSDIGAASQADLVQLEDAVTAIESTSNSALQPSDSVTDLSDVSDAGSGQIITSVERGLINTALQPGTPPSIDLSSNILTLNNGEGGSSDVDLSLYLDDTNLARITSGSLNPNTNVVTFTRDDNTTFDVDFSAILQNATPYSDFTSVDINLINNTTTYATYMSLNFTTPVAGAYKIEATCRWSLNTTGSDILFRALLDGVADPNLQYRIEPQDSGGTGFNAPTTNGGTLNTGTDQVLPFYHMNIANLSAGNHTLDFQFACSVADTRAAILAGTILVTKV